MAAGKYRTIVADPPWETCPCGKGCSYEPYDCGAYTMRRYFCDPLPQISTSSKDHG